MTKRTTRQWEFWRGGFWKRPVLVGLFSLVGLLGGPALLLQTPASWAAGRALDSGETCEVFPRAHCLTRVAGTFDGPHYERGPGDEWWVRPQSGEVLDFDLTPSDSSDLDARSGEPVMALVFDDSRVAAVDFADGRQVRTHEVGLDGVVWLVLLGVAAFGLGLMGLSFAWGSWRRTGSLFAVHGHGWGDSGVSLGLFAAACLLFAPTLFGGLPMFFGAPTWIVIACALVGLVLTVTAAWKVGIKPVTR